MVFLNSLITILESPNTFIFLDFMSIALFHPCKIASYSTLLCVHWNSSLHANTIIFPLGSLSMHPTPTPSRDQDPSKNIVHISGSPLGLVMDSYFVLFSQFLGLLKLVHTFNLSLDTMLGCP